MWYFLTAIVLLIGIIFSSGLMSCNTKAPSEKNLNTNLGSFSGTNDTIKAMFSKKQIDEKLKHLAETPAPTKLSFGAECYKMAYTDHSIYEYICPECGEKTVYSKKKNPEKAYFIQHIEKDINLCRREVQKVSGINIKLDESQFCKHCRPQKDDPVMCLLVNIAGQSETTKVCNIDSKDIQLIQEFLSDKLVHTGEQDEETPLVNNIVRIKELLGIKN